jgi:glycosyltransferase involved in cell wall biosynthesis
MSGNKAGRVLHVTTGLKFGGAETLLLEILPLMRGQNWDIGLMCLRFGELIPLFEQRGFSPICLNAGKGKPSTLIQIKRRIDAFSPDILHVHLFEAEVMTSLAALGTSIPQIATRHNPETFRLSTIIRPLNRFVNRRSRYVISISDAVAEFCRAQEGISGNKILRIRNAINLDRFSPPTIELRRTYRRVRGWDDSLIVGTVGRLTLQKGHRYLLDAWPLVVESYPNAVLIIIGSGELQQDLELQCESLGISQSVVFLGNRWEDLTELFASMDLFVFPSVFEGLGIAVIEAMAMELPVVVSKVDGLRELVNEGTGQFVPPADSEKLAQAIIALLGDSVQRHKLGAAAREFVRAQFDINRYVDDLVEVYTAILENRQPRFDLFYHPGGSV